MTVKFRIRCMSSERGWSQEHWTEDFDTVQEAEARIRWYNDQNTATAVPDYYERAFGDIETLEV